MSTDNMADVVHTNFIHSIKKVHLNGCETSFKPHDVWTWTFLKISLCPKEKKEVIQDWNDMGEGESVMAEFLFMGELTY